MTAATGTGVPSQGMVSKRGVVVKDHVAAPRRAAGRKTRARRPRHWDRVHQTKGGLLSLLAARIDGAHAKVRNDDLYLVRRFVTGRKASFQASEVIAMLGDAQRAWNTMLVLAAGGEVALRGRTLGHQTWIIGRS